MIIGTINQPDLTIRTEVVQDPQFLKTATLEEVIADMTVYNTGVNMTLGRIIITDVDGSTPVTCGTRNVYGSTPYDNVSGTSAICLSPPPPSVCIWKDII